MLMIIETHPIQYHAPVWQYLNQVLGIPVTVVYGSDFSVEGYRDKEFGISIAWDADLLEGYKSIFLSKSREGGAKSDLEVNVKGLEDVIFRLNPTAILSVGYSPKFHSDAVRVAKKIGIPLMFRGETNDQARVRSPLKRLIRYIYLKLFYTNFSALIHVGKQSEKHYKKLGFKTDFQFLSPYCVDPKPFQTDEFSRLACRNKVRKEIGANEDQIVLMFCGKLSPRKNPGLILEAVKGLDSSKHANFFILLVGDGELRQKLENEAKRLNIALKHVGFKKQYELSPFYHASDLLVLPSKLGETWGLVVNEALHHGVPAVVSNRVGCADDLIVSGLTGEVFNNEDAVSLGESLVNAVKLTRILEIRIKCKVKVSEYSVENAAKGIAYAYLRIINKKIDNVEN